MKENQENNINKEEQQEFDPTKVPDQKLHHGSRLAMWILIGAVIIIGVCFLVIAPYMVNGSKDDVTFRIPANATMQNVEDTLNKYFDPDYSKKVMNLLNIQGFDPGKRHGSYLLPEGATPFSTMRKIARGSQTPVKVTINGFRSLPYLAERLSKKMEFSPEDFLKVATDSAFLAQYGLTPEQALSLFLDDTYEIYWTDSPETLLRKIGDNYNLFWSEGRKQQAADLGVTPAEMMIIASIVDCETNQVLEKGKIGRLYINRLDANMKLQADPTVVFAVQDFTIRRVTQEHTRFQSPYNTYLVEGLPPGPIRTTSRKTLTEILNSEPSKDIYMCAREDDSGFHNFAATYEEHLENARRYHEHLNDRGIK